MQRGDGQRELGELGAGPRPAALIRAQLLW